VRHSLSIEHKLTERWSRQQTCTESVGR